AAYVSTITALVYARKAMPPWQVVGMILAALAYLVVGTYAFTRCRRSAKRWPMAVYFVVQILLAAILIKLRGHAAELSLILLPLAGQGALVLSLSWMIVV